jgi:cation transport regulator ChaB
MSQVKQLRTHDEYMEALKVAINKDYTSATNAYGQRKKELKLVWTAIQARTQQGRMQDGEYSAFMEKYQALKKAHQATWKMIEAAYHKGTGDAVSAANMEAEEAATILGSL